MAYKGLGSGAFIPWQQLDEAGNGTFGRILGNLGLDFVSVCPSGAGDKPIAVWPNLATPAGVDNPSPGDPLVHPLHAFPSVSADVVRLALDRGTRILGGLEVLDAGGRAIRELKLTGREAVWDLRDSEGRPVPSGVYWVRPNGKIGGIEGTRVIVCR